jgi:hypothetical protein
VLDIYPLGAHDLLDDIGAHLLLALRVLVAGLASILLLLLTKGAARILWQLFLVDSELQSTHRWQVTWGRGSGTEARQSSP